MERRSMESLADKPAQVFEDQMPVEGKAAEQIVTVDFLHKYIRRLEREMKVKMKEDESDERLLSLFKLYSN